MSGSGGHSDDGLTRRSRARSYQGERIDLTPGHAERIETSRQNERERARRTLIYRHMVEATGRIHYLEVGRWPYQPSAEEVEIQIANMKATTWPNKYPKKSSEVA